MTAVCCCFCCFSWLYFVAVGSFWFFFVCLTAASKNCPLQILAIAYGYSCFQCRFYLCPLFFHSHLLNSSYTRAHTQFPASIPLSRSLYFMLLFANLAVCSVKPLICETCPFLVKGISFLFSSFHLVFIFFQCLLLCWVSSVKVAYWFLAFFL